MCARAVRETFFKLFKDGLIYRGKRLVNWDTHLQTSISDDELYTETVKTNLWHIKYPIVNADGSALTPSPGTPGESGGEGSARATHVTIATTRPETMLADTAVAVHPDDPRWNWAIGKSVKLPLTNRLIPIIADPILVDMAFGSGVVKVTPAHDANDYAVWQRQGGSIEILNLMTPDGKVTNDPRWEKYAGLTLPKARKQIVEDLLAQGFMTEADIKSHEANVNFSDRSKTAIEPYLSDQWFVKMAPLAEPALEAVRTQKIKFYPERHAQQYLSWLVEKRDWPISRQLWWGHRIPVWRQVRAPKPDRKPAQDPVQWWKSEADSRRQDIAVIEDPNDPSKILICLRQPHESTERILAEDGFEQDPDVLDTWFSSALWPHSTLGWPEQSPDLAKWYPTSVLLTGRDIITLWVARMVMTGIYNMGSIPFADVAINPTILDGKGERMSKSKGNGIDPVEIIDLYGADALRFTLTNMATETQDVRMPVKKDAQGRNTSDKFEVGRNFCNKLWNASRFVLSSIENLPSTRDAGVSPAQSEPVDESKWTIADRWILSRLMNTIKEADTALASYRFDQYAKVCYDFFWRDYCDWYVEIVKPRLRDAATAGQTANVLVTCLDQALRLMHPMVPFITETIWWKLNDQRPERSIPSRIPAPPCKRLIHAQWPQFNDGLTSEGAEHVFTKIQELVAAIRNVRNDYKADPKKPVTISISAPGDAARQIAANQSVIELLALCTVKQVAADLPPIANAARTTAAGCDVYVENLVDPEAEKQRNLKRKEEITKQIASIESRLGNEGYVAKAPPKLVEESKAKLADLKAELAKLS
jgi:valyl-tRNA synthetase